jgi:hypothetical protein
MMLGTPMMKLWQFAAILVGIILSSGAHAQLTGCPVSTTTQLGCVKPDGTTITVAAGVISSAGSGSGCLVSGATGAVFNTGSSTCTTNTNVTASGTALSISGEVVIDAAASNAASGNAPVLLTPTISSTHSVGQFILPTLGTTTDNTLYLALHNGVLGTAATHLPSGTKGMPSIYEGSIDTAQAVADVTSTGHVFGCSITIRGGATMDCADAALTISTTAPSGEPAVLFNGTVLRNIAGGTVYGSAVNSAGTVGGDIGYRVLNTAGQPFAMSFADQGQSAAAEKNSLHGYTLFGDNTWTNPAVLVGDTGSGNGTLGTISNHATRIISNNATVALFGPGMQVGSPTGGDKGAGTLNLAAGGVYDNGTGPTGTGAYVHATSPTLVTPALGAATGTSLSVSGQLTSTVAIGTPPFVVTSTTNVPNLNASSLGGATFAAPGAIGSGTASTGAFTTLSASSTVSGTGFSTYLASPPAIGATAAAAGTFTALKGSSLIDTGVTSGQLLLGGGATAITGLAEVDGDCVLGSAGAWVAGSCGGASSVSVTAATPNIVVNPSPGTGTFTVGSTNAINTQSGTGAYAIAAGDAAKQIIRTNASGGADTIANATGSFGSGYSTTYTTGGFAGNTITPTTAKINNLTALTLGAYQTIDINSDGTNYWAALGVPQPATQTGTTVLLDNFTWQGSSGTGNFARVTSPTFVTPTLGAATATTIDKVTITAPATGSTLTIADGKTLTDTSGTGAVALKGATGGGFAQAASTDLSDTANIDLLNAAQSFTAPKRTNTGTPAIATTTFTPVFSTSQNIRIVFPATTCTCTIANPAAIVAGQSGMFELVQGATSASLNPTWGSEYVYAGGTSTITLTTTLSGVDYIPYYVDSTGSFIVLGSIILKPVH